MYNRYKICMYNRYKIYTHIKCICIAVFFAYNRSIRCEVKQMQAIYNVYVICIPDRCISSVVRGHIRPSTGPRLLRMPYGRSELATGHGLGSFGFRGSGSGSGPRVSGCRFRVVKPFKLRCNRLSCSLFARQQ